MPNVYAIAPGAVIGKLVATDDISAASGQPMRTHINSSGLIAYVGFNENPVTQAQDTPAQSSLALLWDGASKLLSARYLSPGGGTFKTGSVPRAALLNGNAAANTGNVTENTIYSTTLAGGEMGLVGQLHIRVYISTTVQGGVATTLRLKLGATALSALTWTTVAERWVDYTLANLGAANSQRIMVLMHTNAAAVTVANAATAVDTSINQTLAITMQNGAAGDSQTVWAAMAMLAPSVNPI